MPSDDPILTPPPVSRHPVDVGLRTEAAITHALVTMGHRVLQPVGTNQRYDLVLDLGDRFLKCQCKTGPLRHGAVRFSARSVRSNRKRIEFRGYEGEVDYFLVYCEDTSDVYAIPIEEARKTGCHLRVVAPTNNQQRGIRWAADYRLPSPAEARQAA